MFYAFEIVPSDHWQMMVSEQRWSLVLAMLNRVIPACGGARHSPVQVRFNPRSKRGGRGFTISGRERVEKCVLGFEWTMVRVSSGFMFRTSMENKDWPKEDKDWSVVLYKYGQHRRGKSLGKEGGPH